MGFLDNFKQGETDENAFGGSIEDLPFDSLPEGVSSWEELDGDNSELAPEQPKAEAPDDVDRPL